MKEQQATLSVVVAIISDTTTALAHTTHLRGCLDSLSRQEFPPSMEVIVPYRPDTEGIEDLMRVYPTVKFLCVNDLKGLRGKGNSRSHHNELRARGVAEASGSVVALLEDVGRAEPDWCHQILQEHLRDYAVVGGAIENGIDSVLNWAVYFCDFGQYGNPVVDGVALSVSDANASYKKSALSLIRTVWQERFDEIVVNKTLMSRGEKLALSPRLVVYQRRDGLKLDQTLRERYIWGRSYGADKGQTLGARRLLYAAAAPLLPVVLLLRTARIVFSKKRHRSAFLKASPAILLLLGSWACGEMIGYVSQTDSSRMEASGRRTTTPN